MTLPRTTQDKSPPPKVALISSGLGNTMRGFEISTARWFTALRKYTDLDLRLFTGGPVPGATRLWNFPRNSPWTSFAHHIPFIPEQNRWEFTYGVEQISFWSALNFQLIEWKPDVIWVKDVPLAHLLLGSRAAFGLHYKLIFSNGSKFKPSTYQHFDLIQQINKRCYEAAIEFGIPSTKMEFLSNCVILDEPAQTRIQTRQELGLSDADYAIICVAAWNRYHKRIDYLIEEVAALNDPSVKLILCGAPEVDTEALQELGKRLLGDRVTWLTVEESKVPSLLRAADIFVLPSLVEGLGNALIEAALCSMPVITHPHEGAQYSIADDFWYTDLSIKSNLTERLRSWRQTPPTAERIRQLRESVEERFSAEKQARQFEEMVYRVLSRKAPSAAADFREQQSKSAVGETLKI